MKIELLGTREKWEERHVHRDVHVHVLSLKNKERKEGRTASTALEFHILCLSVIGYFFPSRDWLTVC